MKFHPKSKVNFAAIAGARERRDSGRKDCLCSKCQRFQPCVDIPWAGQGPAIHRKIRRVEMTAILC